MTITKPEFVDGVGTFADSYRGFIIDQWGVLHNGSEPYPQVMETLAELKSRGRHLVLLTNSGRRAGSNRQQMAKLGFDLSLFDRIVTSGEATWLALSERSFEPFASLGTRCLLFTRQDDTGSVEGLDLDLVDRAESADFIYLTWLDGLTHSLDDFRSTLEIARHRQLPLVCANPDKVAVGADGLTIAPGALADLYAEMGGEVIYVGKPHRPIYKACLDILADLDPSEIVAVGDSMEHDICGANNAGMATAFVMDGIHAEQFASKETRPSQLAALANRFDTMPDFAIERFTW